MRQHCSRTMSINCNQVDDCVKYFTGNGFISVLHEIREIESLQ